MNRYYIYIIRCSDNSLYTGITTDLDRRLKEHITKSRVGAKYTKSHEFLNLEICFETTCRSLASILEYNIKKLKKSDKEYIIKSKSLYKLKEKIDINFYKLVIK